MIHSDSSEYLAECDQRRAYISGFDGSAGCAVITHNEARLWTDGRYWLQAEKQLDEWVVGVVTLLQLEISLTFQSISTGDGR
jgi:hypothetical protein